MSSLYKQAGKGDKPRPYNPGRYAIGYANIKWKNGKQWLAKAMPPRAPKGRGL